MHTRFVVGAIIGGEENNGVVENAVGSITITVRISKAVNERSDALDRVAIISARVAK